MPVTFQPLGARVCACGGSIPGALPATVTTCIQCVKAELRASIVALDQRAQAERFQHAALRGIALLEEYGMSPQEAYRAVFEPSGQSTR